MGRQDKIQYIISAFDSLGLPINENQACQYYDLYEFMVDYNKNVNLTSIIDFEEVVVKHYIDSVLPFSMFSPTEGASFIDVGTGAGFPALPLLIFRPDLKGTLCDSLQKRCVYLERACEKIGVKAEIIHARSEELGRGRREQYDFSTARAVSAMPVLSEYCIPFVKVGGYFTALKSVNEDISAAKNAVTLLGGAIKNIEDYKLPNGDDRRVVRIKKISQTPTKYPRSTANISKKPL